MTSTSNGRHTTIAADTLYWAVLRTSELPTRHACTVQLGYLFERFLPVRIEDVHSCYHRLAENEVLACGIDRATLRDRAAGNGVVTLCPDSIPAFVDLEVDPRTLNLLTGPFEPRVVRRSRRRVVAHAIAMTVLLFAFMCLGLERRTRTVQEQAADVAKSQRRVQEQALSLVADESEAVSVAGSQPLELRFLAQLRILRRTRQIGMPAEDAVPFEATESLTALLRQWPRLDGDEPLYCQTQSIGISASGIVIRATAPTSEELRRLAEALRGIESWELMQPEIQRGRDSVQATMRFVQRRTKLSHEDGRP